MKTNLKGAFLTTLAMLGALLVLGNGPARAADMCFQDDYYSTFVGKSFSFPRAGTCKSFNGHELGTGCVLSGTACGTSDNVDVRFNLNVSCESGYYGTTSFRIDRLYSNINQAGFGYACASNASTPGSWVCTQWHINTVPCPASRPVS